MRRLLKAAVLVVLHRWGWSDGQIVRLLTAIVRRFRDA